jgi:hypothetical protein
MQWYEWVYYISFLLGFLYAIATFLIGNFFGGAEGTGHDVSGHDTGGHDAGAAAHAGGHDVHFSPFSPVVISMFLASFGGTGIICIKLFEVRNVLTHLPVSLGAGILIGGLTFYFFYKVFASVQGSVLPTSQDIIGSEAEVITTIPGHESLGEIAFVAKGVRQNAPARSEDGTQIPARTSVVISKIVGSTMYVKAARR